METQQSVGYIQRAKDAAAAAVATKWKEYPTPEGKQGQMAFGCGTGVETDVNYYDRLKSDLANSYYWSGNMMCDYIFFVCQWHPWVGIIFSHPNHPWTKGERVAMLILSIGISIVPAAAISNHDKDNTAQAAAAGTSSLLFITIPNVILGVILYQMSIADTRCPQCAGCCNCIKNAIFGISFFAAAVGSLVAYLILEGVGHEKSTTEMLTEAGITLWKGMSLSAIIWFPLWMLLPCQLGFFSLWCAEKKAKETEEEEAAKAPLCAE